MSARSHALYSVRPQLFFFFFHSSVRLPFTVTVSPEVRLNTARIGQKRGKDTILECRITAFPQARMYWTRLGKEVVTTSNKYRVEAYDEGGRTITLSLAIENLQTSDFGDYVCHASNSLDTDEETMILYGMIITWRFQISFFALKLVTI